MRARMRVVFNNLEKLLDLINSFPRVEEWVESEKFDTHFARTFITFTRAICAPFIKSLLSRMPDFTRDITSKRPRLTRTRVIKREFS